MTSGNALRRDGEQLQRVRPVPISFPNRRHDDLVMDRRQCDHRSPDDRLSVHAVQIQIRVGERPVRSMSSKTRCAMQHSTHLRSSPQMSPMSLALICGPLETSRVWNPGMRHDDGCGVGWFASHELGESFNPTPSAACQ